MTVFQNTLDLLFTKEAPSGELFHLASTFFHDITQPEMIWANLAENYFISPVS